MTVIDDVFRANVALRVVTFGASHLIAAGFFDKCVLALITVANESFRLCFFNCMPYRQHLVLLNLFATHRDMRWLEAKSTAGLSTLGIVAPELFVDLDGRTLCFVVAKGALGEKIQARSFEFFLLLEMLQPRK